VTDEELRAESEETDGAFKIGLESRILSEGNRVFIIREPRLKTSVVAGVKAVEQGENGPSKPKCIPCMQYAHAGV